MVPDNLGEIRKLILGKWQNSDWALRFHSYSGTDTGRVTAEADEMVVAEMSYSIDFDAQIPILCLIGAKSDYYEIKDIDTKKGRLTLLDLDSKTILVFKKQ